MVSEQHSDTKVHTIGPGTVIIANHIMRDTEAGARSPDGGDTTIQVGRGLGEECNIGDICKYINIFIQAGPRSDALTNTGWLEWAFVRKRSLDTNPTNTNLGILTLGTVCTNYFRNECIYTGVIPVGRRQPNMVALHIKIPKNFQKLLFGEQLVLFLFFRTVSATETGTADCRVLTSFIYRNYH